jgi:glycerol-3-phosphate dehydrogenase (NAD(P)+)
MAARAINEQRRHPKFFASAGPLSPDLAASTVLEEVVGGASLVIVSEPSGAFGAAAQALGRVIDERQVVFSSTKGLDPSANRRMTELLTEHTHCTEVGTIGGPNITSDIMAGHLTALLVASPSARAILVASRALMTPRVRVSATNDLLSVELISALKNVAAIAVGIATGCGLAINTVSFVATRCIGEVERLMTALGGDPRAILDLCGIGDLYLTWTHPGSLNRRVGIELGQGKRLDEILADIDEVPEGIHSVRAHVSLAAAHGVMAPIASGLLAIIDGLLPPTALERLIAET